jgi:hypothetical protein
MRGICKGLIMSLDLQSQLQRYLGLDEYEIASAVSQFMSSARTLVDVGANDGYYTVAFLGSKADCVIACEPGAVCDELVANAAANGHKLSKRFRVERRLVGSDVDLAEIVDGCPLPVFLKVDVDGGELEILRSIEPYPHLGETLWVVETHSRELEGRCVDWFTSRNFRTRIISPAFWRRAIPERRPLAHNRWLIAQSA